MSSIEMQGTNIARPTRIRGNSHLPGDVLAFLIPFAQVIHFSAFGDIYGSDFIILPVLPFVFLKHGRQLFSGPAKTVFVLGCLWFGNQVLTDAIRQTPFDDWTRGFAKILTFLFALVVLYLLTNKRPQRIFIFAIGLGAGGIMMFFVNPDPWALTMPWKFGFGPALAWLGVAASCLIYRQRGLGPWVAAFFLMLIGVGYVLLGSRAQGAAVALTAAFLIFQQFSVARGRRGRPVGWVGFATLGLLGFLVGNGLLQIYGIAASEGMLGVYQQQKYLAQSRGNLGVFLAGRNEILASSKAIMDSPIIGHGSWAKDRQYQIDLYQALSEAGIAPTFDPSDPKLVMVIPAHSHIAGTWVEAGIMGGIFWAWILILGLRSLMSLSQAKRGYSPLFAYVLMTMLWAIPFSPFGGPGRLLSPFYVCTTLVALGPSASRATRKWRSNEQLSAA